MIHVMPFLISAPHTGTHLYVFIMNQIKVSCIWFDANIRISNRAHVSTCNASVWRFILVGFLIKEARKANGSIVAGHRRYLFAWHSRRSRHRPKIPADDRRNSTPADPTISENSLRSDCWAIIYLSHPLSPRWTRLSWSATTWYCRRCAAWTTSSWSPPASRYRTSRTWRNGATGWWTTSCTIRPTTCSCSSSSSSLLGERTVTLYLIRYPYHLLELINRGNILFISADAVVLRFLCVQNIW